MTTLVKSLALLARKVPGTEFAVIGGLAVLARLEGAHRVTDDLDAVAEQHGDEPTVVEAVVCVDGLDGLLGGTEIDCIAVGNVPAGGDYLDIFRLISHPAMTGAIALSLREAPHDLGSWCIGEIERRMLTDVDRTVGVISRSGAAESYGPSAAQMRQAGETVIDRYERGP
jgi:hypothetical protein